MSDASRGPDLRTDMVHAYVFRRAPEGVEFLQIRRTREPARGTWQICAGGIEAGERADEAAVREMHEELALTPAQMRFLWQLDSVRPFYMRSWRTSPRDVVVLGPAFCAEVEPEWEPTLNDEHDAHRWVHERACETEFMWPTQVETVREILTYLARPSLARDGLRVHLVR